MNNRERMVSVIIPYYNRLNCIIGCLESVLNQTYSNLEVIIVDDGSKESAEELLKPYLGERVRYHRYMPNQGACHARNVGVSMARGDYIAFQDSDDLWHPDKLEKQLNYLHSGGWDFVFCGMNRTATLHAKPSYHPTDSFDESGDVLEQLLAVNRISTQTMLLTRETAERLSFDESFPKSQDWDYALNAALKGVKIGYLPVALVDSEIQPNSITATQKLGPALERIYRKYYSEYQKYPASHARVLDDIARSYRKTDQKKAVHYQYLSLTTHFTLKRLVKYLLTAVSILK